MTEDSLEQDFVDISYAKDGGMLKRVLVEGSGSETPGLESTVKVHYVGRLHSNGSKFDSSYDKPPRSPGRPIEKFKFTVGMGQVIRGWDLGIRTMKQGEKSILHCAAAYAYGEHGVPPVIPPHASLDFEIELFSWEDKVSRPPSAFGSSDSEDDDGSPTSKVAMGRRRSLVD